MPDTKRPKDDDDFAANLKMVAEAAKLPDDEAEIAADDEGVSALAQKIEKLRSEEDS